LVFFHDFVPPVTPELEAGVVEKGAELTGRAGAMQPKLCFRSGKRHFLHVNGALGSAMKA
jgi:hypothetical protein